MNILDAGWGQWSLVDEASDTVTYFGYVDHAQNDSDPTCAIMEVKKSGNVTTRKWADGNVLRDKSWDDRATLTYKFLV